MNKMHVGIDPGKDGAFAIIQGDQITKTKFPMIGNEYDIKAIMDIYAAFDPANCHVVLEDVKALQGPMKAGNWSLSRGKTIHEMCCLFYKIPFTMVHSKTWQKEIWQGIEKQANTKDTTLLAIKRLFPNEDLRKSSRSEKDHGGITDALAMAEYCRRRFS